MGWVFGLSPGNLFPRCSSCLPGVPALQFWAGASCLGAPFWESPRCWLSRWFCVVDGSSGLNSHLILNFLAYCFVGNFLSKKIDSKKIERRKFSKIDKIKRLQIIDQLKAEENKTNYALNTKEMLYLTPDALLIPYTELNKIFDLDDLEIKYQELKRILSNFSYLKTKSIERSIKFANECATKVVQKKGVVTL